MYFQRADTQERQLLRAGDSPKVNVRLFFTIALFTLAVIFIFSVDSGSTSSVQLNTTNITDPYSVDTFIMMSADELEKVDIALVNLVCAKNLKGSESLDINKCLKTLDKWAEIIKEDTSKRLPSFHANPARYDNSVNLFKVVNMVLTLKEQIGVDYNLEIMKTTNFIDSKNFFIHGCIEGNKRGGCISIPILCVCVGRRLGYPLKLVLTREHVFFRWDDGKEVFNMEACCPGCNSYPDEHYKNWPKKITDEDVINNAYLRSLTPSEELGLFLETRGHCLFDEGKISDALVMYSYAYKLMPDSISRLANIDMVLRHEIKKFTKMEGSDRIEDNEKVKEN